MEFPADAPMMAPKEYTRYSKEKGTLGDSVVEVTATYTLPQK